MKTQNSLAQWNTERQITHALIDTAQGFNKHLATFSRFWERVKPEYFAIEDFRIVIIEMQELINRNEPAGNIIVSKNDDVQETIYKNELLCPHENLFATDTAITNLIEAHQNREREKLQECLIDELKTNPDKNSVLSKYTAEFNRIGNSEKIDTANGLKLMEEFKALIENTPSESESYGYSFGIPKLDKVVNGIRKGLMYILGARSKSGKTRFIVHSIKQCLRQKGKAAFLSLEMQPKDVNGMLVSSLSQINGKKFMLNQGKPPIDSFTPHEKNKFGETLAELSYYYESNRLNIIRPQSMTPDSILEHLKTLSKTYDVVFIDFLTNIDFEQSKENFASVLEKFCQKLARIAKDENIAIFTAVQLNQNAEREAATAGDIKHSSGIIEAADVAIILDYPFKRNGMNQNTTGNFKAKEPAKKNYPADYFEAQIIQRYGESGIIKFNGNLGTCNFYGDDNGYIEHSEAF